MIRSLRLLFLCLALLIASCTKRSTEDKTYSEAPIIFISIDTLRADHLPAYGYKNVETPAIDRLRADSILFTSAYSQVPLTLPSHVSLLTGLLPANDGVRNNIGYRFDATKHHSLPQTLHDRGYATGAAVSAYVLRGSTGIASMFESYDDAIASRAGIAIGSLQRPGDVARESAQRWIDAHGKSPFFFLLHLFEPHSPYEPPEPFASRYANKYDGEIATADAIVGRFVDFLKARGIYDRAVIVLLSDHGEGLYEHGEPEHGIFLYRESIHVPLMVKLPSSDRRGETIARPVALVDLAPSVARLVGAPMAGKVDGESLFQPKARDAVRRIYSETVYPRVHLGWSELRSLIDDRYHYIQAPRPELYAFPDDPEERTNVLSNQRRIYSSMQKEIAAYGTGVEMPEHVDPEEAKKLAALGYLGSESAAGSGPLPDPKDGISQIAAMMDAMRLEHEGKRDQAIRAFRSIADAAPRFADAWNQLALLLEEDARYEEAADAYRNAIKATTPGAAGEFALSLGAVLLRLEKYDDAAAHARLGLAANPDGAHMLLARIALAQQKVADAEAEVRQVDSSGSFGVASKVLLAQIMTQKGSLPDALSLLDQASRESAEKNLGPVESLAFARGDALARMNRMPEAIASFRQEISAFPTNRLAYSSLAIIYMLRGDRAQAEGVMEEMARANPNRRAYLFAAHTLDELEDGAAAAEWRRRAERVQ